MNDKNVKASIASFIVLFIITACSLSQPNNSQTQVLQAQVSALETQNALLLENQNTNLQNPQNAPVTEATSPTLQPTPTVHGMNNPSGILPAGMPAIVDNYVMVVDRSGMQIEGEYIGFEIQLRVIGEESNLFRYNVASIKLRDNLDNQYDYVLNFHGERCTESDFFKPKQIMVEPEGKYILEPPSGSSYFWWCLDNMDEYIPLFTGLIPKNVKSLFLEFDGFGPFSNFAYEFPL